VIQISEDQRREVEKIGGLAEIVENRSFMAFKVHSIVINVLDVAIL